MVIPADHPSAMAHPSTAIIPGLNPLPGPHFCQIDTGLIVEIIGDHPIAGGGSSDVWKGMATAEASTCYLVAIKVLRQFSSSSSQVELQKHLEREVRVWKLLDHESIARFCGVVYNSNGTPALVSPWYPNGSADRYLKQYPDADPIKIIWEIILGVEYLHNRKVVHGDIKAANVMVDELGHAKLIDFGLSRLIESVTGSTGFTISSVSLSIRWCAPELILSDAARVTTSTDVYAWASTTLQLLTGDVPYSSQRERTVLLTILNKVPPPRPCRPLRYSISQSEDLWGLLEACWAEAPQRPTISEIRGRMRNFCT